MQSLYFFYKPKVNGSFTNIFVHFVHVFYVIKLFLCTFHNHLFFTFFITFSVPDTAVFYKVKSYSFLKKVCVNHGIPFEKNGIDTLKLARRLLPEVEHKNLDVLCAYFQINPGNSHRALDDAVTRPSALL